MNKEVKFSRFVGIAIIIICIIIAVLSLMSAIWQNENANNIIYLEDDSGTALSIPKSNVVTEYVNTEKNISSEKYVLYIDVRLPKVNIETETTEKLNNDIYSKYQELYNNVTSIENNESIEIDYTYDYLDNDTILEIVITKKTTITGENNTEVTKYIYDIVNDSYIAE